MGYQYIENFKNARDCLIREYEEEDVTKLPDERYSIRLTYYDQAQLKALRKAYTAQIEELNREVMHLWNVCDGLYVIDRNEKGFDDWDTLSERMLNPKAKRGLFGAKKEPEQEADDYDKSWNEISFIPAKETVVEKENPTDENQLEEIGARFPAMLKKLEDIYQDVKDERRRVLEARIDFLKEQYEEFANKINPYHVQPGLLLDIDIVSIKKKKTTMMNMANVINEFLFSVSKGFSDAAFVSLSRTRSTERADIDQEFISVVE
jgi:archaellum component FlaC